MQAKVAGLSARVFIFDDDQGVRRIVSQIARALGLTPDDFDRLPAFLAAVKQRAPELIILDLALGHTDAVEVLCNLQTVNFKGAVLLISGRDRATLENVKAVGISHGLLMLPPLRKPFKPAELRAALAETPQRRPATKALAADTAVDLNEALKEGWLDLWYQPKVNLRTLTTCGAEALVRANHPDLGVVLPGAFLPGADHPLHVPLFDFVATRAMRDWHHMADAGLRLPLSVNAPLSVMYSGDLMRSLRGVLPRVRDFPGVIVEISEDEIIHDPVRAREMAAQLQIYGVSLSVDDFGAGAASLSRLRELPVSELKLDRSFVKGCATDERNRSVCEAVARIGHDFGCHVCAEGVESPEETSVLRDLGFDTAQGFLFGRPVPLREFIQTYSSGPERPTADVTKSTERAA